MQQQAKTLSRPTTHFVSEAISIIGILAIVLVCIIVPRQLPTREKFFSLVDADYRQRYNDDSISFAAVCVISTLIPILIFLAEPLWDWWKNGDVGVFLRGYYWSSGYFIGLGLCVSTVEVMKYFSQRLRPDFFTRCFPSGTPPGLTGPIVGTSACTGNTDIIAEGFTSFPSGHTATAFFLRCVHLAILLSPVHSVARYFGEE